jgi:hypothetical protein
MQIFGAPALPPQPSPLDRKMAIAQGELGEYNQYAEIMRIINLPVMFPMIQGEITEFSRQRILVEAWNRGFKLWWNQCEAVCAYEAIAGAFCPIGVGWGKTLISLMIANAAYAKGVKKSMLFVPSQVYVQLTTTDIKWARARVPLNVPFHYLGEKGIQARRALAHSGKAGCYISTYSLMSTKDAEECLHAIAPEEISLDECQNVRHRHAARTQRLMRYVEERKPEIVALSGTITNKSIKDYHHLIRAALGHRCPLPHSVTLANEWAAVIDAGASTDDAVQSTGQSGPLTPVIHWAQQHFPGEKLPENVIGFRRAYRLRLTHTQGVVASSDAEIGTSLVISNRPIEHPEHFSGWETLKELFNKVELEWKTPNGDEIEHAMQKWKWLFELSAGFYNQLTWPSDETFAQRRNIGVADAAQILERSRDHHEAGQEYASALRSWLDRQGRQGLDTPLLVGNDMARNGPKNVGQALYDLWRVWKSLDFDNRPDRDSTAVRICDYKIQAAVRWALEIKDRGGIIWVMNKEIGKWTYEALCAAGVNALHCPAGPAHNASILDPANVGRMLVASIDAHGTGKNLQHFSEQFFVQFPRPASDAEQVLGRTHRNGQMADELIVNLCNTTLFDQLNFAACLNDALYIQQTTDTRQKLIYAAYDPMPKIFPTAVLFERGLNNIKLSAQQQQDLAEKFGMEAA